MIRLQKIFYVLAITVFSASSFWAATNAEVETNTGVKVYAGSEFNQDLTDYATELQQKMLAENPEIAKYAPKIENYFFVSSDSYDKVVEFYKKQFNVEKMEDMTAAITQPGALTQDKLKAFQAELPLRQQAEMYQLLYQDKKIDPAKFEGNQKSAVFSTGLVPTVSISDRFIHPKTYEVVEKTLILLMKVEELPAGIPGQQVPGGASEPPAQEQTAQ